MIKDMSITTILNASPTVEVDRKMLYCLARRFQSYEATAGKENSPFMGCAYCKITNGDEEKNCIHFLNGPGFYKYFRELTGVNLSLLAPESNKLHKEVGIGTKQLY